MSGKDLEIEKKVYIHISDFLHEIDNPDLIGGDSNLCVEKRDDNDLILYTQNEEVYKKYNYNGKIFSHKDPVTEIISDIVEPIRESVTIDKQNMCFVTFGDNAFGKSSLLGTLPSFSDNEHNVCFYTLVTLFYQIEQERSEGKDSVLKISASEIFVDQIIDLVKGEYKESKSDCAFVTVEDIGEAVDTLKAIYTIRTQYVQQLENESFESSCSQSHLVVEISIEGGEGSGVVSLIDSIGFDSIVYPKGLVSGSSTPKESASEPELSANQNEYFMYSLKNLILELRGDGNEMTINMIGLINSSIDSFQETLNTLEFCDNFIYSNFDLDESSMLVDENCETVLVPHISLNGPMNQYLHKQHLSPSDSIKFDQMENSNGPSQRNICKEVQISYLDNRLDPNGMPGDLEMANATASIPDSSEQYSIISGESKRSIKQEIECEVEKLMSKFCSKEELQDICQENINPNIRESVARRHKQDIEEFAEKLIGTINSKLSQRDHSKSSDISDVRRHTHMYVRKDPVNASSILFSNKHVVRGNHTFDNKNLSKFVLKENVQNLSPISKGSDQDIVKQEWNELSKVEEKEDIMVGREIVIDNSNIEKPSNSNHLSHSTVKKDTSTKGDEINIISNLKEELKSEFEKSINSQIYDFKSQDASSEEEKIEGNLEFSVHEYSRAYEKKTKETINETAEDDIIDVEMIKVATGNSAKKQKKKKSKKLKNEGIKLIQNSLIKGENLFGDLLTFFLGGGSETERVDRGREKQRKGKRSNSLFGCFGSRSRKKLIKEDPPESLMIKKVNSSTNDAQASLVTKDKKKSKKEKKAKKEKKHKSKNQRKKIEEEKENTIEVMHKTDRIPVVKNFEKSQGSQVINLNSTFKKPDLFPHSRNEAATLDTKFKTEECEESPKDSHRRKFTSQGMIDTMELTRKPPKKGTTNSQVQFSSLTKVKSGGNFKFSPKGSLHSETKMQTRASQKTTSFNSKLNRDVIKDYLKGKVDHSSSQDQSANHSKFSVNTKGQDQKLKLDLSKISNN
ncbi:unnamed protein product [Moneuplotes crassus]|uniref:Kinesin motor domain-containing protein n=1 Tax=Euplotes crassus TaxID=5936 RepID=A0AAD1XUA7_EUPCR|nr:unnamed protein product [Moneuplotes crassus]